MHRLITITLLILLLYLAVGAVVGLAAMHDSAGEDLNARNRCDTWRACQDRNAFLIASGLIIWPVYIVANPLLALAIVVIVVAAMLLGRRSAPRKNP